MKAELSLVKCSSYSLTEVYPAVKRALDLLGGISRFIKPQSKVLVKPNLLLAKEPEAGITTHPQVVRSVVKLLKEINCRIYLGDGPSVWGNHIENVDEVYRATGMKKIAEEEGIELVRFDKRKLRQGIPFAAFLDECEHLVNLPKFKTHELTLLTGAIKNLFGLVVGTYKTELHKRYFNKEDFAQMLTSIYAEVKPALTIIDGIVTIEGDGPASSGKIRQADVILAGQDCVALDTILAMLMGIQPEEVLTTKFAAERNLGTCQIKEISLLGEKLEDVKGRPFLLPAASWTRKVPQPIAKLLLKMIKHYPYVVDENCTRCSACVSACPQKVVSLKDKGITFDYKDCISCFCCQEVCPVAAIKVKKSLFAQIIGL